MIEDDVQTRCLLAAEKAKKLSITQIDIAQVVGASQSQVSRVLAGHSKRRSKLVTKICEYINQYAQPPHTGATGLNAELAAALAKVWDGTPQQAHLLANLLLAAGELMANSSPSYDARK